MAPAVAEVILVDEAAAAADDLPEFDVLAGQDPFVERVVVVVAHADAMVADLELVQVRILPAHRGLDHVVQRLEAEGVLHFDTAPDRRVDVFQGDVQHQPALRVVLGQIVKRVVRSRFCHEGVQGFDQGTVVVARVGGEHGRPVVRALACLDVASLGEQQQHFQMR